MAQLIKSEEAKIRWTTYKKDIYLSTFVWKQAERILAWQKWYREKVGQQGMLKKIWEF